MKASRDYEPGEIVYVRGDSRRWVTVVSRVNAADTPFPHYVVERDGVTSVISKLELTSKPINSKEKRRAGRATTPENATDQSEVTE